MATLHIRLGDVMGAGAPVYAPGATLREVIATSGISQTLNAVAESGDFLRATVTGGNIYLTVGRAANGSGLPASSTTGDLVLDGTTIDLGPLSAGDRVSVIDAA